MLSGVLGFCTRGAPSNAARWCCFLVDARISGLRVLCPAVLPRGHAVLLCCCRAVQRRVWSNQPRMRCWRCDTAKLCTAAAAACTGCITHASHYMQHSLAAGDSSLTSNACKTAAGQQYMGLLATACQAGRMTATSCWSAANKQVLVCNGLSFSKQCAEACRTAAAAA